MFPPFLEEARAKINLALHVLGRRSDGLHELDSVVAFADIGDTLLFEPAVATSLSITGPHGANLSSGADNLVLKALAAVSQHVKLPTLRITLNKVLPVASGIGGGSADAAAALRGAIRASGVHLPRETLMEIALALGADVPVCLAGKASRMQGVGQVITPFALPETAIVLVNPHIACNTADVFKALGLKAGQRYLSPLDPAKPDTWRNDLTRPAALVRPVITEVLAALHGVEGFAAVRMSGSGATCFGLARSLAQAEVAADKLSRLRPDWWVRAARLH
jgi:4-diphosphocytidyl-2-C-methyl-D-erythritol kinase